jgi:hypothetical protein
MSFRSSRSGDSESAIALLKMLGEHPLKKGKSQKIGEFNDFAHFYIN